MSFKSSMASQLTKKRKHQEARSS